LLFSGLMKVSWSTLCDVLQGWWMPCTRQHFEVHWVGHCTWVRIALAHTPQRQSVVYCCFTVSQI